MVFLLESAREQPFSQCCRRMLWDFGMGPTVYKKLSTAGHGSLNKNILPELFSPSFLASLLLDST